MPIKSKSQPAKPLLERYEHDGFFDEMLDSQDGLRPHYRRFQELFQTLTAREFEAKRQAVDLAFLCQGITLNPPHKVFSTHLHGHSAFAVFAESIAEAAQDSDVQLNARPGLFR